MSAAFEAALARVSRAAFAGVDAVIIVPPFVSLDAPVLGPHLLQACAREAGFDVRVFYANLLLAPLIGEVRYRRIAEDALTPDLGLVSEQFFTAAAFSRAPANDPAAAWADAVARVLADLDVTLVGCSVRYQQLAASLAVLDRLKRLRPDVTTMLGGASCEPEMAEATASLAPAVDYVFAGESESTFCEALAHLRAGRPLGARVVLGTPCAALDNLPAPRYDEFLEARRSALGRDAEGDVWLPYESSRGCWWGLKHHCAFCGDRSVLMPYRQKSPDRVIHDLAALTRAYPSCKVEMTDDLMPYEYFTTVLPRMARETPGAKLFYMQKANLTLDRLVALERAGVVSILVGIESFSTRILRDIDKGTTAAQNVDVLRLAASAGLFVDWNLLYGFPGDELEEYREMLALVPLLRHLSPPVGPGRVSLPRYSPYVRAPERYGITNLRPLAAYRDAFPTAANLDGLAYVFDGDYVSATRDRPPIIDELAREVQRWRAMWTAGESCLSIERLRGDRFLLIDRRGLDDVPPVQILTRAEAEAALVRRPADAVPPGLRAWTIGSKLAVVLDEEHVPLATADPMLLRELGADARADAMQKGPPPVSRSPGDHQGVRPLL